MDDKMLWSQQVLSQKKSMLDLCMRLMRFLGTKDQEHFSNGMSLFKILI